MCPPPFQRPPTTPRRIIDSRLAGPTTRRHAGLTRHSGRVYDLTCPRAIGFGEAAGLIAEATGRTVRHVDVDPQVFVERQVAAGGAPDVARLLTGLLVAIGDGSGGARSPTAWNGALGRAPRTFETFVAEAAAAGHWD
ncbi:hypothetical protein [Streptomyces cuspidosporus]|uniref:NmrA-like domain-containing protein n=1 Tax=Streptomyces cuspidosporus TaxID=66882 RepID=A0ABP5S769_9ACTN